MLQLSAEMDRPVALAAAETDGELSSPNVAGSSRGYFELLPDEGTDGGGGSRQRQHQSSAPPWPRLSRHELSAAKGTAHQPPLRPNSSLSRKPRRMRICSDCRAEPKTVNPGADASLCAEGNMSRRDSPSSCLIRRSLSGKHSEFSLVLGRRPQSVSGCAAQLSRSFINRYRVHPYR